MSIPTTTAASAASVVRRGPMLAVLLAGQVMASMDGSIVSVAAQTIRGDLRADGAAVQLIVSGYLLTTGVLLVTCARLGDIVGHRRAFLAGLAWFTGASLACGLAPTAGVLVAARVAQAAGAALLTPQVFSLIQLHWDGPARRRAIGLYGMVLALGVALGQVIGGLVVGADLFGLAWRPVFLVNVPVGAVLLAVGPRLLPDSRAEGRPRLDPLGVAVLTVAMAAVTVPLIFGRDHGWPAWCWVSLAGGAALLAVFGRHERRARHPLLDPAALRPAGVRPGLAACWIVMGCYTVFLLVLTLHLQSALGFSPLRAGLAFVPYTVGFGTLSLTWTRYPRRLRGALPVAGPVAFAAGAVLLALLHRHQWNAYAASPLLLLAGAGHAAGYSPLIARITSLVEPRLASAVSALNSTGPMLAGVTAVAGLGSVYFAAPSSADGLLRVVAAVAVLLMAGTACAWRAVRDRRAAPEGLTRA
ncbi:MFS transporter [Nonomuraea roseoviolacea]|uniref:MFS family permease n=1 Tax=Nonomuraea roseoviolacea subsp. carminata TaxID=160689 RepID=A0ABT1K7H0_9ACTN|nr:MFS transporter [Nonomuraea roseoviolacea]MCP2349647.1 MFS family permease [Nonomuraea roseoviolacea subsp. carminata]